MKVINIESLPLHRRIGIAIESKLRMMVVKICRFAE